MNFAALLSAYQLVKRFYPVIKMVATMIDEAMPASPAKAKAEAAFNMLAHASDEFKTVTPELQTAFDSGISLYKAEKAILGVAPAAAPAAPAAA